MSNEELIAQTVDCDCEVLNESQISARKELLCRLEAGAKAIEAMEKVLRDWPYVLKMGKIVEDYQQY